LADTRAVEKSMRGKCGLEKKKEKTGRRRKKRGKRERKALETTRCLYAVNNRR
jgi:hypothetical protein